MIGPLVQLSDYIAECRRLLHDPHSQYWTDEDLAAYINDALRQRDLQTGQNRVLFDVALTIGQDTYMLADVLTQNPEPPVGPSDITMGNTLQTIAFTPALALGYTVIASTSWGADVSISNASVTTFDASFSVAAPANAVLYWQVTGPDVKPNASRVFDLIGINLMYNNLRVVMSQMSYTELNTILRPYNPPMTWAPTGYARYGPNTIIFGPAPSIAYDTEWDCSTIGAPLNYPAEVDLLPYPYTQPVAYYACYLAKINERQMEEAAAFMSMWNENLNTAQNSRVGMVPTPYSSGIVRF